MINFALMVFLVITCETIGSQGDPYFRSAVVLLFQYQAPCGN